MKILFTSDTFFGRELAAKQRGFVDTEEMNETLINNWNNKVSKDDLVFHLGNFGWDPISSESAAIFLNGKIKFIGGSYDSYLSELSLVRSGRHELLPPICYLNKKNIALSHWPMLDWEAKQENSMHLHGGEVPSLLDDGVRFNISCDKWNLAPIDLDTLKDIIKTKSLTFI